MPKLHDITYKLAYAHGLATGRRFARACRNTAGIQERLLGRILKSHRQTDFGLQHDFSAIGSDVDAYRAAVPVRDYEGHRSWIDRVVAGEENVLFGKRQRLLMFNQTSGTTAAPKLIPVTSRWLQNYRRTSLLWGTLALKDHPGMFIGKILHVTGGLREDATALGVPIGSASAMHAASQKRAARNFYAVPESVSYIQDYDARYYTIARLALEASISLLATANPSTVLRLVRLIDDRSEELIRDIRDGTLARSLKIEPGLRERIAAPLRPAPDRAKFLSELRRVGDGRLRPRDYWPDLQFLANWQGGPLVAYLSEFPEWFDPATPIRDIGLLASEARINVPVADGTASGALDIQSHFFEFLPVEDADRPGAATVLAHEVEVGREYLLLFTTWSGLYRYDIADVVKVTGYLESNPLIAFQHKGRHMTSITGEKISERQVVEAVRQAGAALGESPSTFVVYPQHHPGEVPGYVLALEEGGAGAASEWATAFDQELASQNIEYAAKRSSGRLAPAIAELVPDGVFESARSAHLASSGTPEQYKHVYLRPSAPSYLESWAASRTSESPDEFD